MVVRGDPPLLPCLLPPPTHASATPPSVVGGQTGAAPSELRLSVIILSGGDGYEGRAQKAAHTQPAAMSDGALVFHTHTHTRTHTYTHIQTHTNTHTNTHTHTHTQTNTHTNPHTHTHPQHKQTR